MFLERSNFLGCVVRGVAWLCMSECKSKQKYRRQTHHNSIGESNDAFLGVNLLYYGGKQRLLTNQPENIFSPGCVTEGYYLCRPRLPLDSDMFV